MTEYELLASTRIKGLDKKLGGLSRGKVIAITYPYNLNPCNLLNQITLNSLYAGNRLLYIALEYNRPDALESLKTLHKQNTSIPQDRKTRLRIKDCHKDKISIPELISIAKAKKVDVIVIDNFYDIKPKDFTGVIQTIEFLRHIAESNNCLIFCRLLHKEKENIKTKKFINKFDGVISFEKEKGIKGKISLHATNPNKRKGKWYTFENFEDTCGIKTDKEKSLFSKFKPKTPIKPLEPTKPLKPKNKECNIEGYNKAYILTDTGEVYSMGYKHFHTRTKLSPYVCKQNHRLYVPLYDNERERANHFIDELVMSHFGTPAPTDMEFPVLNHKDGDLKNNNINNLEWMSAYDLNDKFKIYQK